MGAFGNTLSVYLTTMNPTMECSLFSQVICLCLVASMQHLSSAGNDIDDLYAKFRNLQDELLAVNERLRLAVDDNLLMKRQMEIMSKDMDIREQQMQKELDRVKLENADFRKHLSKLQTQFDFNMHRSTYFGNQNYTDLGDSIELDVTSEVHNNLNKRLLLPEAGNNRIAFSAALTHDQSLGYHQTIEYDKVITNEGSAYDSTSGHFIAPYKGLYLLTATVVNTKAHSHHIEMVRNGNQIVAFYQAPDDYNFGSQTVVVVLEKGDKIWVRKFLEQGSGYIRGTASLLYNTFSGVLLFNIG